MFLIKGHDIVYSCCNRLNKRLTWTGIRDQVFYFQMESVMAWLFDKTRVKALTDVVCMFRIMAFRQKHPEKINYKERYKMINLTDPAKTQIDDYFQGKTPTPIRVFLNSGG